MGAVRIYKEDIGDKYPWHIRTDDCNVYDSKWCDFGEDHGGYCNGYSSYEEALEDLNDPHSPIGEYLTK